LWQRSSAQVVSSVQLGSVVPRVLAVQLPPALQRPQREQQLVPAVQLLPALQRLQRE
jgi:hypothetical protein